MLTESEAMSLSEAEIIYEIGRMKYQWCEWRDGLLSYHTVDPDNGYQGRWRVCPDWGGDYDIAAKLFPGKKPVAVGNPSQAMSLCRGFVMENFECLPDWVGPDDTARSRILQHAGRRRDNGRELTEDEIYMNSLLENGRNGRK